MFFPKTVVVSPSSKENILDFGILSATDTSSLVFVVVNNNPIEVRVMWAQIAKTALCSLVDKHQGYYEHEEIVRVRLDWTCCFSFKMYLYCTVSNLSDICFTAGNKVVASDRRQLVYGAADHRERKQECCTEPSRGASEHFSGSL